MASARGLRKELIDAALVYGAAWEKYDAEWKARPPPDVRLPDGSRSSALDEAQTAAVNAVNAAGRHIEELSKKLYAQEKEKQAKATAAKPLKAVAP